MDKTIFVDRTRGRYEPKAEYDFDVACNIGEHVDFEDYNPYGDYEMYEIIDIIHLPNESKKVVEMRVIHSGNVTISSSDSEREGEN